MYPCGICVEAFNCAVLTTLCMHLWLRELWGNELIKCSDIFKTSVMGYLEGFSLGLPMKSSNFRPHYEKLSMCCRRCSGVSKTKLISHHQRLTFPLKVKTKWKHKPLIWHKMKPVQLYLCQHKSEKFCISCRIWINDTHSVWGYHTSINNLHLLRTLCCKYAASA